VAIARQQQFIGYEAHDGELGAIVTSSVRLWCGGCGGERGSLVSAFLSATLIVCLHKGALVRLG
jgi:hypothetical protein